MYIPHSQFVQSVLDRSRSGLTGLPRLANARIAGAFRFPTRPLFPYLVRPLHRDEEDDHGSQTAREQRGGCSRSQARPDGGAATPNPTDGGIVARIGMPRIPKIAPGARSTSPRYPVDCPGRRARPWRMPDLYPSAAPDPGDPPRFPATFVTFVTFVTFASFVTRSLPRTRSGVPLADAGRDVPHPEDRAETIGLATAPRRAAPRRRSWRDFSVNFGSRPLSTAHQGPSRDHCP